MKHIIIAESAYTAQNLNHPQKQRDAVYSLGHIYKYYRLTEYKYEIIGYISWYSIKNKKAWNDMKELYDFRSYKYLGIDK